MKKCFVAFLICVLFSLPGIAQTDTIANTSLMVTNPPGYPGGVDIDMNFTTSWARDFSVTHTGMNKLVCIGAYGNGTTLNYGYIGGNNTTTPWIAPWEVFLPSGNVAIGSTSASDKLDVNGSMFVHGSASGLYIGEDSTNSYGTKLNSIKPSPANTRVIRFDCATAVANGGWEFYNSSSAKSMMVVQQSGNVGIGTTNPQSMLAVDGTVTAKGVTVTLNNWSDFVFDSAYQRMPLSAVAAYTSANKHLPDIPPATEIEKDGLNLGDMQKLQMQKIEELTLYAIEADRRIARQDSLLVQLQARLQAQQAEIDRLKVQQTTHP